MGVYIKISRHKRDKDYIVYESQIYDLVEADLELAEKAQVGEGIYFRSGIQTVSYLINHPFKGDWGLYEMSDFFFYFMKISPDLGISYKEVCGKKIVGLFIPNKILKVVNAILNNLSSLRDACADENEIEQLKHLKKMLEDSIQNKDLIMVKVTE